MTGTNPELTGRKAAEYDEAASSSGTKSVSRDEGVMCAGNIAGTACNPRAVIRSDPQVKRAEDRTGRASLLHHAQGNSTDAAQAMQEAANEKNSEASEAHKMNTWYYKRIIVIIFSCV